MKRIFAVLMMGLLSSGIFMSACATNNQVKNEDLRINYDRPEVCDCEGKSYPIACKTRTKHFAFDFTVQNGEKPDELIFDGTMSSSVGKSLRYAMALNENRNMYYLYFLKEGLIVQRIKLWVLNDRMSNALKLNKIFSRIDFDALMVGYTVYHER